jgi:two-component system response regulator PilR (NtrC family)
LFLDEVAELPLAMQVKLLRAIQERRVRKVGATAEEPVDVRLLSATHQDLNKLVGAGRFRQDLYYRLNVIELRVPSLRERAEDIGLIAEYLLQRLAERVDGKPPRLAPEARLALQRHSFPGNVRELENVLERALALATTDELQPLDLMLPQPEIDLLLEPELPEGVSGSAAPDADAPLAELPPESFAIIEGIPNNLPAYLDALERDAIRAAVVRTRNNRTAAAQLLGITFRQLRYRMQRLGLK